MLKSFKKDRIYEYYYLIILFVILAQLFFIPSIRLGVVTSVIILLVLYNKINRHDLLRNTFINKLVLAYIFYNSFSIVLYIFSEIPLSVFFAEWSNSILPIFFFYLPSKGKTESFRFYNITLLVLIISFIIGFYLWLNESELYFNFMQTTEGAGTDLYFFQSLYGITATGAFGVIGFLLSSGMVLRSNGRSGKIAMLICLFVTILTFRRASLVALFIAIILIHYIAYIKFNFLNKWYFIIEIIFGFLIYKYYLSKYDVFLENFVQRTSEISQGISERSFTWLFAFQDLSFILGKGLGSVGHKAIGLSTKLISDGNFFKMIAEIGIFGSFIFFMILISSLYKGFKEIKNNYLDIGIIFCVSLIGIGSNIFTYQSVVPIFWYAIGRLSNNNKGIPSNMNVILQN